MDSGMERGWGGGVGGASSERDTSACTAPPASPPAYDASVIEPAVAAGTIPLSDVDRAAGNILRAKFAAGLFDGQLPDPAQRPLINSAANRALARRAATGGAVLLSNPHGVLPFGPRLGAAIKRVAVIGPFAGCGSASSAPGSGGGAVCNLTPGLDCMGNDLGNVDGVPSAEACCGVCTANASCAIAVWASDSSICVLKSGCDNPQANAARVRADVGRWTPPPPNPWTW